MSSNGKSMHKERMASLDALRGFDMFLLVGLAGIFRSLPKLFDNEFSKWLSNQFTHPEWHGFTVYDLIFPMFIFIVGVAMPFSFTKRIQKKGGKNKLYKHILIRSLVLAILGIILWQQPGGAHPHYGYYSVLFRIGFSYFFAALIVLNTNIKQQVYWAFGILIVHGLLLRFVPVPDFGIGNFSQEGNLNTYFANQVANFISPNFRHVLSLSLIPSVSNALFGAIAGQWLISKKKSTTKSIGLLIAGVAFILAGLIIHFDIPINKKLGSPSFTLLTCGISGVLLSTFYWIIDVKGKNKWAFFFVVVGMNPITIYVANSLVKFGNIANVFVGGYDFGNAQPLVFAVALASIKWLFLYYLYRQKIFFKI